MTHRDGRGVWEGREHFQLHWASRSLCSRGTVHLRPEKLREGEIAKICERAKSHERKTDHL